MFDVTWNNDELELTEAAVMCHRSPIRAVWSTRHQYYNADIMYHFLADGTVIRYTPTGHYGWEIDSGRCGLHVVGVVPMTYYTHNFLLVHAENELGTHWYVWGTTVDPNKSHLIRGAAKNAACMAIHRLMYYRVETYASRGVHIAMAVPGNLGRWRLYEGTQLIPLVEISKAERFDDARAWVDSQSEAWTEGASVVHRVTSDDDFRVQSMIKKLASREEE